MDSTVAAELGAYLLPGRNADPKLAISQAKQAEAAGLGAVYLSERLGTKDLATLGGAISQATERITLTAAATHLQTRHPMALASLGLTLAALMDGRFRLGFGRAIPQVWRIMGLPQASNQVLVDGANLLRRLWAGEEVSYDGPLGTFPLMRLAERPDVDPPPILLTAIGPKSLALAGAHFDGVLLHAFLTPEGHRRSVEAVRKASVDAGRPEDAVRAYGMVVVAPNLPPDEVDSRVRARLVTYLHAPALGESLVRANGWDRRVLDGLAAHPLIVALDGKTADGNLTTEQLIEVSRVVPDEWFHEGAAIGTPAECAASLRSLLRHGADELILHGSTTDLLGPTIDAYTSGAA